AVAAASAAAPAAVVVVRADESAALIPFQSVLSSSHGHPPAFDTCLRCSSKSSRERGRLTASRGWRRGTFHTPVRRTLPWRLRLPIRSLRRRLRRPQSRRPRRLERPPPIRRRFPGRSSASRAFSTRPCPGSGPDGAFRAAVDRSGPVPFVETPCCVALVALLLLRCFGCVALVALLWLRWFGCVASVACLGWWCCGWGAGFVVVCRRWGCCATAGLALS